MKTEALLHHIQKESFNYFIHEYNPRNGLVPDATRPRAPCSIAATGLALACYPVGVERGLIKRSDALKRTRRSLEFFLKASHKGFFYHFLDIQTGERIWRSELSTIDSSLVFAGALTAAQYFGGEVVQMAGELFARADWRWARNGSALLSHGWRPESGFLPYHWAGYTEGMLAYILGLGSPTYPLPAKSYRARFSSYPWRKIYDREFLYAGPLFIHQLPHVWIDFRKIQDDYMRSKSIDYFENSRRATYIHQQYAIRNPRGFKGYDAACWGLTASDGPGPCLRRGRRYFGYIARGAPFGPDDGTIAPWAAITSLPFAPEIVLPVIHRFGDLELQQKSRYGFVSSYNATFPGKWHSRWHFGLNHGPLVLMIENFRTGLIWRLMRECPVIERGLRRAGFAGGWLG